MNLIYFVDNKLGGVTSLNYNLTSNCPVDVKQWVIQLDLAESIYARANTTFPVEREIHFSFSHRQNYHAVLKKLFNSIPTTKGALILNYDTEMAMLDQFEVNHTTFQLVHDDYNVGLAIQYEHIVDVFICHNSVIYEQLQQKLPTRKNEIFYLPHGVKIPTFFRVRPDQTSPLKLLFLGRMDRSKGVFDLPIISKMLTDKGVLFEWLCIGNGPELANLKAAWNPDVPVVFESPNSNEEVLKRCAEQDVFVLPTKFEGSPVSLLETMSVGLVPVISKIPGGITDIVKKNIGFVVEMNDNQGFANAIEQLWHNPVLLAEMGARCRSKIQAEFDVKVTSKRYVDLFVRFPEFYKKKKIRKIKVGARLDKPWIPNFVTKVIRSLT
jgi:glycosyltransferase involved in cell wall biosynthesis